MPTSWTSRSRRSMASSSASAIRSGRAASSARCAPFPCCSTCATRWTSWRPMRCCSTTSTRWRPTAGPWPTARAARTSGCATACRAPARCWHAGSTCPMTRSTSCAPASTTRPSSSNSAAATRICIRCIWEAIERAEVMAEEPVRIDLMKYFGYFVTESSGHASEYVPYFRKSAAMVNEELVPRFTDPAQPLVRLWAHRRLSAPLPAPAGAVRRADYRRADRGRRSFPTERTPRVRLDRSSRRWRPTSPARINGNVPNDGLITNLPDGCCVEVPCLVDANGVQPTLCRQPAAAAGRAQPHQHQRAEPDRRGRADAATSTPSTTP